MILNVDWTCLLTHFANNTWICIHSLNWILTSEIMKKNFHTQQNYFLKNKKIIIVNVNWTCLLSHFENNTSSTQKPSPIRMLVSVHDKGLLRITTCQVNFNLGESDKKCQKLINWHAWYDLVWAPYPVTDWLYKYQFGSVQVLLKQGLLKLRPPPA